MTAFDDIKTNNWPATSNDLEDFLVLKLPLNDQASLTESLPVTAGSTVLYPKRTLTNTGVSLEAIGSSHALTFRGASAPTSHLLNNTQTAATWWYNTDHYDSNDAANTSFSDWVFDPPLEGVTSIEVDSRHDNQYFNPYYYQVYDENDTALVASPSDKTGSGNGNYTSIYSGAATKVKRIKQYGGAGNDDTNGLKVNGTILNASNGISGLTTVGSTGATATYSTGGPKKHYDNNAVFNGSAFLGTTSSSSDFTFGTGDFTIEYWTNYNDISVSNSQVGDFQSSTTSGGLSTSYTTGVINSFYPSGTLNFNIAGAGVGVIAGLAAGTWYHIAFLRENGSVRLYKDGILQATTSNTGNVTATHLAIGGYYSASYFRNGPLQDFRVYKGIAKYTTNFTPPPAILG